MAGTVCTHGCAAGYVQTGGTASRTCNETDGTWIGTPITCSLLPPTIPAGQELHVLEVGRCSSARVPRGQWSPVGWAPALALVEASATPALSL